MTGVAQELIDRLQPMTNHDGRQYSTSKLCMERAIGIRSMNHSTQQQYAITVSEESPQQKLHCQWNQ